MVCVFNLTTTEHSGYFHEVPNPTAFPQNRAGRQAEEHLMVLGVLSPKTCLMDRAFPRDSRQFVITPPQSQRGKATASSTSVLQHTPVQ